MPAPDAAAAQNVSARPASVSLTVVVPPRESAEPLAAVEPLSIVHRSANALDVEAAVGIRGRSATRVEVSLGGEWRADAAQVWVRNTRGDLERLDNHARVIALDQPAGGAVGATTVRLLVEPGGLLPGATLAVPLQYRVRVGSGETAATWTFTSVLRLDATP
jgi:hypothetical protein